MINRSEKEEYRLLKERINNIKSRLFASIWFCENLNSLQNDSIYILLRAWQSFAALVAEFFDDEKIELDLLALDEVKHTLEPFFKRHLTESDLETWGRSFEKISAYKESIWKEEKISEDLEDSIKTLQDTLALGVKALKKEINKKYHQDFFSLLKRYTPLGIVFFLVILLGVYLIFALKFKTYNWKEWKSWDSNWEVEGISQGYRSLEIGRSVDKNICKIGDTFFENCYGTHANSKIKITFKPKFNTFSGKCGKDAEVGAKGTIRCRITDRYNKVLYESGVLNHENPLDDFSISVKGRDLLYLYILDADDGIYHDHADWVDLKLE